MPLVGIEIVCQNGRIRIYDCQNVSLLSYLPTDSIGGGRVSDIWGWTDSATGREFALVGRTAGTSFVEISEPLNPRYLGQLPLHQDARPSIWRDIKVYRSHAFIVADGAGRHGMQIFDLAGLRDVTTAPTTFQETAHYDRVGSVHNLAINEATGFAYLVGAVGEGETCGSALHIVDIRDPRQPAFVGCHVEPRTGRGYIHDAHCTIYRGPDRTYRGKEICLNAAARAVSIVDVTDKQHPTTISVAAYPNVGYTHQGWLSEDHRYFFLGDESDERRQQFNTRTIVLDLKDLRAPTVVKEFFGTTGATDHNLYVRGRYVYQSNYKAGLRVLDVHDPTDPKEVAYLDTAPSTGNGPGFAGSWSNYPYFHSGLIAVTSMNEGLYIVRHTPTGTGQ